GTKGTRRRSQSSNVSSGGQLGKTEAARSRSLRAAPIGMQLLHRGPGRPLPCRIGGTDTAEVELLDPLAVVGLAGEHVPLGIRRDTADAEEVTGVAPAAAEAGDFLERCTIQNAHLVATAVGDVEEALLRIGREGDVPGGTETQRLRRDRA